MRSDMFKVIVERPRRGVGYWRDLPNGYRVAKRFKLDHDLEVNDEFCGRKLPIRNRRLGWDGKELNENLSPLWRFIESRVGLPWNDVYSEICQHINVNSTVQQHVRDHVDQHVETKTYRGEDGKVYGCGRYGPDIVNNGDLYVEPETGILRNTVDYGYAGSLRWKVWGPRNKEKLNPSKVVGINHFEKIDGVWFRLVLEPVGTYEEFSRKQYLPIVRENFKTDQDYQKALDRRRYAYNQHVRDQTQKYGKPLVFVRKMTASKKELKKYGLREVI